MSRIKTLKVVLGILNINASAHFCAYIKSSFGCEMLRDPGDSKVSGGGEQTNNALSLLLKKTQERYFVHPQGVASCLLAQATRLLWLSCSFLTFYKYICCNEIDCQHTRQF